MHSMRSYLALMAVGVLVVSSANMVVCAEPVGGVRIRLAHHECHTGLIHAAQDEHSTPCMDDCHFHAPECCQDTPLSFSPVPVTKPIPADTLSAEIKIGVAPDPLICSLLPRNAFRMEVDLVLSTTVLLI